MNDDATFEKNAKLLAEGWGGLLTVPDGLDRIVAGNILAKLAGKYIDSKQDIKALILIQERKRLGI